MLQPKIPHPFNVFILTIDHISPPGPAPGSQVQFAFTLTNDTDIDVASGTVTGSYGGEFAITHLAKGASVSGTLTFTAPHAGKGTTVVVQFFKLPLPTGVEFPPPDAEATATIDIGYTWYDAQTGQPSPNPAPFDLVTTSFDDNGIPLNPMHGSQTWSPSQLADSSLCSGANPWTSPCTTQSTWIDKSLKCAASGSLGGHANWMLATYEGRVYWHDHSNYLLDDDYSFTLYRDDLAGMTAVDIRKQEYLHCEFNSDQTINHFSTWYWNQLHQAVDADGGKGGFSHQDWPQTRPIFDGREAIVMGLFGLDCAHECGSELHPVYAMALHVSSDVDNDVWAIFVRNWGDEGYCSSGQERIDPDHPFTFTFRFRKPGAIAVNSVPAAASDPSGENGTVFYAANDGAGTAWSGPQLLPNEGALVSFELPPASQGQRINGMLNLKWEISTEAKTAWLSLPHGGSSFATIGELKTSSDLAEPHETAEPERQIGEMIAQMTPVERQALSERLGGLLSSPPKDQVLVPLREAILEAKPISRWGRAPHVVNVPDIQRSERDRQVWDALHAIYGDRIPGSRGDRGPQQHPGDPSL